MKTPARTVRTHGTHAARASVAYRQLFERGEKDETFV
jgi:hypothetical protein